MENVIRPLEIKLVFFCFADEKSLNHLMFHYLVSKNIWREIFTWLGMNIVISTGSIAAFNFHIGMSRKSLNSSKTTMIWLATYLNIWICRNNILFWGTDILISINKNSVICNFMHKSFELFKIKVIDYFGCKG